MAVCSSDIEDCMLPSPVIQDSGSTVTILAAVYLDSGPETHRCVWVSKYTQSLLLYTTLFCTVKFGHEVDESLRFVKRKRFV